MEGHTVDSIAQRKEQAAGWFATLRDQICTSFETIEAGLSGTENVEMPAGRFTRKIWERDGGGGGEMSVMHGRVFEKVGVNISTVHGTFSEEFRKSIPGGRCGWTVLGRRHLTGGASVQSARAIGAYEHPVHCDLAGVVWRRW